MNETSHSRARPLILATGMQSSGSTLVSWCFLQRSDTDGTLDGDSDLIPLPPAGTRAPVLWYKTTISSFTLMEQEALLEDEGYRVKPLLMVRDPRAVWISLSDKPYGRNGVTAEDPPLRLRFRRFLASWRHARERGLPLFRYEDLAVDAERALRQLCDELELPWQPDMLTWPKPADAIADGRHGNPRFRRSGRAGFHTAFDSGLAGRLSGAIHEADLEWLDTTFAEFYRVHDYPRRVEGLSLLPGRLRPAWEASRRREWRLRQKPWRYLAVKLGLSRYRPPPQ